MDPKRRRLLSMLVGGVIALVILLYIKNTRREQPRLVDANRNLVRKVQPQYTQAARKAHYEGQVKVNIIIGTDGTAHDIEIVNSPGYGMDQNIVETVKQWLWDSVFIRENQKATLTIIFKLAH
jgi:TonB family protein